MEVEQMVVETNNAKYLHIIDQLS